MSPQQTIAHYRISSKLGEGGMGVVYAAVDTHLNRTVAIKVLPSEAVADAGRRERFIQEARAASALDHPNIITIHDVAEFEGQYFIVMQYVAGKTLRALLHRGGLPLNEVLRYAIQTADALAQTHARGIIHRDLKPENVMVTEQGQVKILDFGLAKLTERDERDELAATQSIKLNQAARTEEGTILGTVAYMSPEQAEGKRVDARSDIFSFGSLLYEMLTGRRAFRGDTKIATVSAVLNKEPQPPGEIVSGIPAEAAKIISRCMRKDPDRRIQHMDDVKIALEDLKEDSIAGRAAVVEHPRKKRRAPFPATAAAAAIVLVGATAMLTWWLARPQPPAPLHPLVRLTADDGLATDPAISPDGKLVAYASDRSGEGNLDIWMQQIAGGEPIRLTRDPGDERGPSFSYDGSKIVFSSDRDGGGVYVMPSLGGERKLIARRGHHPRFSPDGKWVTYEVSEPGSGDPAAQGSAQVYVVPSAGGTPRQIQPEFAALRSPVWCPDGKHILFWGVTKTNPYIIDWWVTPLEGGTPARTFAVDALRSLQSSSYWMPEVWTADHDVLFSNAAMSADSSSVFQIALSPRTYKSSGPIRRLTFGTGQDFAPSLSASDGKSARLVFASLISRRNIWGIPVDANQGKVKGEIKQLTHGAALLDNPYLSRDGKKLTFSVEHLGNRDVWIQDLETGAVSPIAATPSDEYYPVLSPDGSRVAYKEGGAASGRLLAIPSRGGLAEELSSDCVHAWSWSGDFSKILYWPTATARAQINLLNLSSGERSEFLTHSTYRIYQSYFSPDDHWVVFLANTRPDVGRIYVVPFRPGTAPPESAWIPVTDGQFRDDKPRWSPDGNLIYFLSERDGFRCLWAQRLEPATKRPTGIPFGVYHFHHARQSLMNVGLGPLEMSMGRDKIVLNLPDSTGSIWMTQVEGQK